MVTINKVLFPLDRGRGLGGDVIDDTFDVTDFLKALSCVRGEENPNLRYPFDSLQLSANLCDFGTVNS